MSTNPLHVLVTCGCLIVMMALKVGANGANKYSLMYRSNLLNMVGIIDEDAPACEDFFQHACGSYDVWNMKEQVLQPFLYNKQDRIQFFEEHKMEFTTKVGCLLRDLYTNCKARNQQNVFNPVALPQWERMLKEIDFLAVHIHSYVQWPYLQHQWETLQPKHNLSWITLAAQFAAHGLPTLIDVYFAEQAVFVAPIDQVTCPSEEIINASLISILDKERNPQIAIIVANELSRFCRELTGELPLSGEVYVVNDVDNSQLLDNDFTLEYFEKFFQYLNCSQAEVAAAQKITIHEEKLLRVLTVLRTSEPRIIFNYIMWQAYEQLRYEDCYQLTEEFEPLLFTEYFQWHVFSKYFGRNVALANFIFHTTRFQKQRKNILLGDDWLQFLLLPSKHKRRDLNLERLILAYGKDHLNAELFAAKYEHLEENSEKQFYAQLLSMRRIKLRQSLFSPLVDEDDINGGAYIMRKFLHFSILLIKQPLYHYFATEGFDLWYRANFHATTDGFYTALDCLQQQDLMLLQSEEESLYASGGGLTEQQVEEIYRFYNTFVESQRDYEFWLQAESFAFAEDFVLEYFKLNAERILFYSVAQLHCGRNNLNFSTLINRTFMNMPAFGTAFNCSADAAMNPPVQCMVKRIR